MAGLALESTDVVRQRSALLGDRHGPTALTPEVLAQQGNGVSLARQLHPLPVRVCGDFEALDQTPMSGGRALLFALILVICDTRKERSVTETGLGNNA